jgi:xylan 1,4-beta-xylosidase
MFGPLSLGLALSSLALASPDPIFQFPDCKSGPLSKNGVCDMSKSAEERAMALVKAMTFEEKVANSINASPGSKRLGLPPYEWWQEALVC